MSAGTAWAADLGGKRGTTLSGAILTGGFAVGPVASGLLAQFLPAAAGLTVPFAVTVAASLAVAASAARGGEIVPVIEPQPEPGHDVEGRPGLVIGRTGEARRGFGVALAASVPMALWVFASVTVHGGRCMRGDTRVASRRDGPFGPLRLARSAETRWVRDGFVSDERRPLLRNEQKRHFANSLLTLVLKNTLLVASAIDFGSAAAEASRREGRPATGRHSGDPVSPVSK
ncbi:hypothetical protein P0W64_01745 [Tsukamurella sp. 8F]|uniref:hypothetical protein n=1 Tax=unclassified Tsukamurella TaxID=2633480 RepID=UPI0023B943B1|nr:MULTISPECIES: hypothetical protein [unclassified Tsukamurella]MDF0531038.1 hypothetical protein [Tsukamurella sp. 8J]MDF0585495.1 hypothetical protein [Tsukamurella sp. 8F]